MTTRIAMISEHASPLAQPGSIDCGGQNVYVAEVAKRLEAAGHEVDVFTRRDDPGSPRVSRWSQGVRVVHVSAGPAHFVPKEELLPYMDEFAANVVEYCRRLRRRFDVSHANFFMSGLASLALRKAMGTPFVVTFHALGRVRRLHQAEADRFPAERANIEERLVAAADRIIAECPQDAGHLRDLYHAEEARMRVVPCGVDPFVFHAVPRDLARAAVGLPRDGFVVLQLGRLVPRKGVDDAIRAVAIARRQHGVPATLLIVGGDHDEPDPQRTPEIARLRGIAQELGAADAVRFVGRRDPSVLRLFYSAADVFVSLPWYEPFGMTPLEAMACGTPVVGSAVGGLTHTIEHGRTGFLVPPHAPDEAAIRIAELYQAPDLRLAFGCAGLRRTRARFSWDAVVESLGRVYEEIVDQVRTPAAAAQRAMLGAAGSAGHAGLVAPMGELAVLGNNG